MIPLNIGHQRTGLRTPSSLIRSQCRVLTPDFSGGGEGLPCLAAGWGVVLSELIGVWPCESLLVWTEWQLDEGAGFSPDNCVLLKPWWPPPPTPPLPMTTHDSCLDTPTRRHTSQFPLKCVAWNNTLSQQVTYRLRKFCKILFGVGMRSKL